MNIFDTLDENTAVTKDEGEAAEEAFGMQDGEILYVPSDEECKEIIEAVLFAAGHPVTFTKLASVLHTTPSAVEQIVAAYMDEYNSVGDGKLPRGIMMLMFDGSCQLCTKEQYGSYIREALGIRKGGNLSQSSIEVLSIIAYNQPVTRAFVDTVRGVDSSYAVSSMCDKHLIEVCGRLDVPGRPLLYRTTPDFLRVFGLQSLDELPKIAAAAAKSHDDAEILPIEDASEGPIQESIPGIDGDADAENCAVTDGGETE